MPLLVLAAQEPELGLRRVAASALADIAKHLPELAQAVVDAGMCLASYLLILQCELNKYCFALFHVLSQLHYIWLCMCL